jgi:peptidoglycan/LPS O-acetylase OafA/YrhL
MMADAQSGETSRILQLDGLRGVAVAAVVLYHYLCLDLAPPPGGVLAYAQVAFRLGWCGVDLFFVLSGFLIGGILLDAKSSQRYFQTFYLRRFHRIFPLYYLWIGVYFLIAFTSLRYLLGPLKFSAERWTIVPTYIFFVQNLVKKRILPFSVAWLIPLWSLAVEEQFYLVMPFLVRFFSRRWLLAILLTTIACAPIFRLIVFQWFPQHTAQYIATPCRADALAMGVLLALGWRHEDWKTRFVRNPMLLSAIVFILLIPVAYLAIYHSSPYDYATSVWGLSCLDAFFAALLLLVLAIPQGRCATIFSQPYLIRIGRISFCLYVIHQAVNAICQAAFVSLHPRITTVSSLGITLLAVGITWTLAKISWRYLEGPMVRRGHNYSF